MNNYDKARELVSQMILYEKATLCSGKDCWNTESIERLGIPSVMVSDGPHGLRKQTDEQDNLGIGGSYPATCFPTASLTACSFDPELLREMGHALAEECIAENVDVILGPGINMKRSPLCGRNFEYFSEDPYLASEVAIGLIDGIQEYGVGTSLKHFAANNQERRRMTISSVVDDRTLMETYLRAFMRVVTKASPTTVMCSYNRINGVYSARNKWLLTDVLRKQWGYDGLVVSDWGATSKRAEGIAAGLDLEMPGNGGLNDHKIVEAVLSGDLSEDDLDAAATNVVRLALDAANRRASSSVGSKDHHDLAVRVAEESMVLLKNESDILPLRFDSSETIGVVGDFAVEPRYQGAGSSNINPILVDSPLEELQKLGANIQYASWDAAGSCAASLSGRDSMSLSAALCVASGFHPASCDTIIVFAGLTDQDETEGVDRAHMRISEKQNRCIHELCQIHDRVIVVLMGGAPMELPWIDEVEGVLLAYLAGEGAGTAIANILSGKVSPSGRLAETWPLRLEDNPSDANFPGNRREVHYDEGIYIGYRYYDTMDVPVQFAFGHGLSYSSFEYSDFRLNSSEVGYGETIRATFTVTNTGTMPAKDTALLFYSSNQAHLPRHQLVGFRKTLLQPGENREVTVEIDTKDMAYYDCARGEFGMVDGDYTLWLGNPLDDSTCLSVAVSVHSDWKNKADDWDACANPDLVRTRLDAAKTSGKSSADSFEGPLGWENCLEDAEGTRIGNILLWGLGKAVRKISQAEPIQEQMMLASAREMPFYGLWTTAAGKVSEQAMDGLLDVLNGRPLKGIGKAISGRK